MVTTWMQQDRVRKEFLICQYGRDIDFEEFPFHTQQGCGPTWQALKIWLHWTWRLDFSEQTLGFLYGYSFKSSFPSCSKKRCKRWTPVLRWAPTWQLQLITNVLIAGKARWIFWGKNFRCSKWSGRVKSWWERERDSEKGKRRNRQEEERGESISQLTVKSLKNLWRIRDLVLQEDHGRARVQGRHSHESCRLPYRLHPSLTSQ